MIRFSVYRGLRKYIERARCIQFYALTEVWRKSSGCFPPLSTHGRVRERCGELVVRILRKCIRRQKSFLLEAVNEIEENIYTEERLKSLRFQTTHGYFSLHFYFTNRSFNNHLNKVDKHLDMFSFRLINL